MSNLTEAFVEYLFRKEALISEKIRDKANACKEDYYSVVQAGARKNRDRWKLVIGNLPEGKASSSAEINGLGITKKYSSGTA